jgi:hypothetical protein
MKGEERLMWKVEENTETKTDEAGPDCQFCHAVRISQFFFYFMHWTSARRGSSHLFLGRPRLLFPVGLYDSMYRGKRL